MTKKTTEPTTVIGKKHVRRKYSAGDDYKAWKAHCDDLKVKSAFHSSEATRYRNDFKKSYENGADGFCNARDDREWEKANNLLTIAAMKESERANAWKSMPVDKLDLPARVLAPLQENGFTTIEQVADWVGKEHREKKKGIAGKFVEVINDAVDKFIAPYHAPILHEELERAKAIQQELSRL